jgi:ADP-ribosyl-[dinitrogen reductase] hydrolase
MRLAPIALYYHPDRENIRHFAAESSRTTHAAAECLDACRYFADVLSRTLSGASKQAILFERPPATQTKRISKIAMGSYRQKTREQIQGSGYVVACLEAALWCFERTDTFREALLQAANLGDDADTTAAVCGQIAGAYYGVEAIPEAWLERLVMAEHIAALADRLRAQKAA